MENLSRVFQKQKQTKRNTWKIEFYNSIQTIRVMNIKSFNIHCQTTWGFFYVKKDVRIKYTSSNFCLHLHHREYVSLGKKVCKKKVSGKVKEVKNLETFYCNWYVEKMTKKFTLQDDEKFCIFVTKDKRQTIIFTMPYI